MNYMHLCFSRVDVCVPDIWDHDFSRFMKIMSKEYPRNLDHNSGDP